MKIDGACHCGYISVEGEADPGEDHGLPLHGLPSRLRLRLPRQCSRSRCDLSIYLKTTAESGNPRLQAFCPRCGSPRSIRPRRERWQWSAPHDGQRRCRTLVKFLAEIQPRAAYPQRCSSNASGLHGRNSARILGIRPSPAGVARASIPAEILAYARAAYPQRRKSRTYRKPIINL